MTSPSFARSLVAVSSVAFALAGCGDDATTPAADAGIDAPRPDVQTAPDVQATTDVQTTTGDGPQPVTINFGAVVGAMPFRCGDRYMVGSPAVQADVVDLRFYVHDVRLVRADGTESPVALTASAWQHEGVALIDFENGTGACDQGDADTNTALLGTVAPGAYVGLRFKIGVPFAMNHVDLTSLPSPLNRSSLFWSWNSGHIFFAATTRAAATRPVTIDGGLADAAAAPGDLGSVMVMNDHFTHVGSTGCMGSPTTGTPVTTCAKPNRPEITFAAFDPSRQRVVVDLAVVKAGVDLTANDGCHSFTPGCTPPFRTLGLDWSTGAADAATQTAFRAE